MFYRLLRWFMAWIPAIVIMAIIFRLSHQPDFGGPGWASAFVLRFLGEGPLLDRIAWTLPYLDRYISWIAHFVEFGALAAAFYWGIRWQWPRARRPFLYAWIATVGYGLLDEWHQSFVPKRHPDPRDILTDAAGAAVALGVIWLLERWVTRNKDQRSVTQAVEVSPDA